MKQEWIARAKRFATYALVGCFDTGMDWVAFTSAHELLHFTPVICQAIGYFVGTVCSYFLNGRITFRDGHIARWRQCLRFVMWNVVSLGVSEVMIGLLTHFGLNPYIAKVGVTLEVALFNYFGYKYIVFAVPKQTEGEQDHDRSSTD